MATRLRKTRRLRGGRHMGWGQVGQHRASGHQGGLGVTGMLKHHYSSMLKYEPDHYGHSATKPPHPNTTKRWAAVRDLDDLFVRHGSRDDKTGQNVLDLGAAGYQKLLGGGKTSTAYAIRIPRLTASAEEKIRAAGGEVLPADG
ncbi:MAG: uL15 family ribosomal protein [Thaumarchaeota archaeon]|nr:uL15 family ribosomal protein [Nitrososphaerota archaeon]MDE0265837.1 uL15 family ribosomal protein [Nitrososphaerota archaeon]MDE0525799.1 uL15 family ribosomal protein [Nitrososphaerota archaeon]